MPPAGSSGESLAGGYGRWVIDLERGWPTERLDLEPLAAAHAAELAPLLDDAALHEFTGGAPLSAAALAARYARLAARRSPGGGQLWGSLVTVLRQAGWTVMAHIHPGHHASQRVARAAGLMPTAAIDDGETRWTSPPPAVS